MERIHFLLLNFNGLKCQRGNCGKLIDLIKDCFPHAKVHEWIEEQGPLLPAPLESTPDIVFLPVKPKGLNDYHLERMRKEWPDVPFLGVVCDHLNGNAFANKSPLASLDDFFCCPITPVDIKLRVVRHLKERRLVSEATGNAQWQNPYAQDGLIGESPAFRKALEKISVLADAEAPVLICGETGTGKELFARAIHYHGLRKGRPFIPVNCGAVPDHLFENELFGHRKGAFTDASTEQQGLVSEAEGGTLFLDEIDTLSSAAQIKLLRFLQDQEYRPLGASKSSKGNVRVLVATNKNLQHLVDDKQFREDLFFRINVFSLALPPLRERIQDISILAEHFLSNVARQIGRGAMYLAPKAQSKLTEYSWPGNVRELESVIHRAARFSTSQNVHQDEIDLPSKEGMQVETESSFRHAKSNMVEAFERKYLLAILAENCGNVSKAAKAAGKERRSFQRLLCKHALNRTAFLKIPK